MYFPALYGYAGGATEWAYSFRVDVVDGCFRLYSPTNLIWLRDARQFSTADEWPSALPGTAA